MKLLLCSVVLLACSQTEASASAASSAVPNAAMARPPSTGGGTHGLSDRASSGAEMERYYPRARYRRFPAAVRPLLRRADFENAQCRGRGDNPATYRACNRRWEIMVALERRGWCRGNERRNANSADDHWLRCSRDRSYRPGQLGAHPPFSDAEIREMTNEAHH